MNNIKRILSGVIGLPLLVVLFVFANKYIIDGFMAIIAMRSFYEYSKSCKGKIKPISWVGYIVCAMIAFIHVIPQEYINILIHLMIPVILLLLFLQVIISNLKWNFADMAYTFLGIAYIVGFTIFIPLLYGIENGKILVWYILIASWGTDIAAYTIGKKFGKHKFSKVSPNKSIEGCIAGLIGATISMILYTLVLNNFFEQNISYVFIGILGIILSVLSQIGDFAASSIKRNLDVKDFSDLIPGHGGMLDRIDSVIFVAPFAYYALILFI